MQKNSAQEQAIQTIEGPMIIIACPGSGKTTTLLHRIHHMIDSGIEPSHILMITFTRAAALEMKSRYEKEYGKDTGVTFQTIHSLCYLILYNHYRKRPEIIEDSEIINYLKYKIKNQKSINDPMDFINDLRTDFSYLKNNRIKLKDFTPKCTENKELFDYLYGEYEKYKKSIHKIDLDDLLIYADMILDKNKTLLKQLQERYQYIQVDEYQDTNYLQRDIIYKMIGEKKNLAVVGDDDQGIYGFRGAKPEIMLNFKKDFPNAKVIHMSTNYRSAKRIIQKADHLIRYNTKRFEKDFIGFHKEEGYADTQRFDTRTEEIKGLTLRIQNLIKTGVDPSEIAVLYRNNNQSVAVSEQLLKNKIPFHSNETVRSKFRHWIFYDIYSYHKLAAGIGTKADLIGVLNHPNRFLYGEEYIEHGLNKRAMLHEIQKKKNLELWQVTKGIKEIEAFFRFLNEIKTDGPEDVIRKMESRLGYRKYIKEYAKSRNQDVSELYDILDDYRADARDYGKNNWDIWMQRIRFYEDTLNKINQMDKGVTLSTMHKAKGLEWEHVFLIDCIAALHPFQKAETVDEKEEERRLFYVAMTRAKKCLYMYYFDHKGSKKVQKSDYLWQC